MSTKLTKKDRDVPARTEIGRLEATPALGTALSLAAAEAVNEGRKQKLINIVAKVHQNLYMAQALLDRSRAQLKAIENGDFSFDMFDNIIFNDHSLQG